MNSNFNIKIVTKLNRETKEGKIKWENYLSTPASIIGSEKLIGNAYQATVLGKYLLLFKYQCQTFYDEDHYEWVEYFRLEFIDSIGKPEWTFPIDTSISDLYESVKYQITGLDKFISNYLSEEERNEGKDDLF